LGRQIFEKCDSNSDGNVTLEEFLGFLKSSYKEKEAAKKGKGAMWLGTMISTLTQNLGHDDIENEAKQAQIQLLRAQAELVFHAIAALGLSNHHASTPINELS
jgi:hypothetical protein